MIDHSTEDILPLSKAAREKVLKHHGRPPHISTLYRWATRGIRGVRLETLLIGGARCTTRQAIYRFIERTNEVEGKPVAAASRRHSLDAAEDELNRAGM